MSLESIDWDKFYELVSKLAENVRENYKVDAIVGIARSGAIPAAILAKIFNINKFYTVRVSFYDEEKPPVRIFREPKILNSNLGNLSGMNVLIVDDFIHTGSTLEVVKKESRLRGAKEVRAAIVAVREDVKTKPEYYAMIFSGCVLFPWDLKEPTL
jgi:hypoxanthine phosphoribosyltransferase